MHHLSESTKHAIDTLSVATVLASLAAWLPPIAALISIIWGVIRIYETRTVQTWLGRKRTRRQNSDA